MKILRFEDWKTGLLIEKGHAPQVLDIAASLPAFRAIDSAAAAVLTSTFGNTGAVSWAPMIEDWDVVGKAMHALNHAAAHDHGTKLSLRPLASVKLTAPLPSPYARIFALGGNVASHMAAAMRQMTGNQAITAETILAENKGLPPWGFQVLADTVCGPDAKVAPPAGIKKFDYESEVAVILRSRGRNLRASDIKIWGFTAWNDLSIRDGRLGVGVPLHRGAFSWGIEKNFDNANPCGPWVVVDEPHDPMKLRVQMRVSGVTRQDWSTSTMMYSFAQTAEHIAAYTSLKTGDIILSGTGHGTAAEYGKDGDRWLKPGDKLEVEVEGVGILRNEVVAW